MSDNDAKKTQNPQILITFDSEDSINFTPQFNSVLPTQILHAGKMLVLMGERRITDVWTQQAMKAAEKKRELDNLRQVIGKG